MTEALTEDVVVTKPVMSADWGIWALVYMQVCAHGECPVERIEQRANELNPPGTSGEWRVVRGDEEKTEVGPDPKRLAPVQCEQDPVRMHWMLSC